MGKVWSTWAALCLATVTAAPLRAEVVSDLAPFLWDSARPEVLVLDGDITRRTPPLLGLALGRFDTVEVLELSSPGGDAYAAMAMVPTIRAAGLATRIEAGDQCYSACSFLYFAGVERAAEGELGVHQLASANEASGHFIMNDVLDVFTDLGVPDTVRRRMMQTPPGEMYVFSPTELAALGLVGPADPLVATDPQAPVSPTDTPPAADPADPAPTDPAPPVAVAPTPDTPAPDALDATDPPATHIALDIAGEANGRVVIELFKDLASEHAARLATLAREGAYDGVVFHRVIDGFMAQTGDVEFGKAGSDLRLAGTGGSSYPDLQAEFSPEPFVTGTVGMARAADPDSANAQFFIMFEPAPHLDGSYTVVGRVVEGLDVVMAIKRGKGANGAVIGEPDRIVRAVALSDLGAPASSVRAPAAAVEVSAGIDVRFDFTEDGRVAVNLGWTLPEELAEVAGCDGGATRTFENGLIECVISMREAEAVFLQSGPANGVAFSTLSDGSRELVIDVTTFLAQLAPGEEDVSEFKDLRFDFVVDATRIVETNGSTTEDGASAQLLLTLEQVFGTPETIPDSFTTRFF